MGNVIEYRTIGININLTPPPNVKKDAEKIKGVSKEFMEKEFPDYQPKNKNQENSSLWMFIVTK